MALDQTILDEMGCGTPDCGHDHSILYLHPRCHPNAAVEVAYHKATGCIVMTCPRCKAHVAEIEVASLALKDQVD